MPLLDADQVPVVPDAPGLVLVVPGVPALVVPGATSIITTSIVIPSPEGQL